MLSLSLCLTLLPPEMDEDAFTAFFDRYQKLVLYKANEIIKNQESAEDIAQEVFIYIARHFEKFYEKEETKAKHYLLLCTESRSIDYIRKERNVTHVDLESAQTEDALIEDAERIVLRKDTALQALTAAEALPEIYRAAIMLQLDGISYADIAEMLNISKDTAYKRAQRGYAMIRERLVKENGE